MTALYSSPATAPPLGTSDHDSVVCRPSVSSSFNTGRTVHAYSRIMGANERAMFSLELRQTKWERLYNTGECALQYDLFQNTIIGLVNKHFPWKTVRRHSNDKPWVNDTYRYMIRRRQRAFMTKGKDDPEYKLYRNKVNRMGKKLRQNFYTNQVAELKSTKPGQWWQNVRKLMGDTKSSPKGPLEHLAAKECDGSLEALADKINSFFTSLCNNMQQLETENEYSKIQVPQIPDAYIIPISNVESQLARLKTTKAQGPDGIPTWILKDFAPILAAPVAAIYNSSIREGYLPQIWRSSFVSPLPKCSPITSVEKGIRPISLTPILCKELESYPVKWLMDIVKSRIDPRQYGTVKGSSTVHALVELMHQLFTCTDGAKYFARILLVDYTKAFDLIDHKIFMNKLKHLQIPDFLLKWLAAFLTDRTQQVKIGSILSDPLPLKGGFPQGTKLGPVLFILQINDLCTSVCDIYKYVDDSSSVEIGQDPKSADTQVAADEISMWSDKNAMQLNAIKTKEVLVDFSKTRTGFKDIIINGEVIQRVPHALILGVTISENLKWNEHIENITTKAAQRLFMLYQLKKAGLPWRDMVSVYISKIRSLLEYACEAWHPGLNTYLHKDIESIQVRAMRIIFSRDITYPDALHTANLLTLKERRDALCIKFGKKMEHLDHKLHHLLPVKRQYIYNLRQQPIYESNKTKTTRANGSLVNWYLKQ